MTMQLRLSAARLIVKPVLCPFGPLGSTCKQLETDAARTLADCHKQVSQWL